MTLRPFAVLSVTALALALAGAAPAKTTTVNVTAKDFAFVLSTSTVRHGRVTFVIRNKGHALHDFVVAGHSSKTIGPGRSTRLTVTFKKPGRYPYRCTVDSHAELGMKGVLRVT